MSTSTNVTEDLGSLPQEL
ncbi:69f2dddd-294a-49fa-b18a-c46a2c2debd9 [Thermothielavioides terrestris]|uniref:69f2dddd-294a-49fa-b18a-c46a2c2debd9 n=1 Tax=Thermothielavioides terrestris TaxID=2587410 RepID=A0A446BVT2_9PEZI|nr:69f2dddd-294a-49fa-b18a-c46a2c2debd9 [Thermothielavioides terrestris]